mmetsp:Transcript_40460/g.107261  ORF Transcript_40460/g.107261 Transcript_40460/m.107261 type:complete len:83 (-) Transcript_40460:239-487(-)
MCRILDSSLYARRNREETSVAQPLAKTRREALEPLELLSSGAATTFRLEHGGLQELASDDSLFLSREVNDVNDVGEFQAARN